MLNRRFYRGPEPELPHRPSAVYAGKRCESGCFSISFSASTTWPRLEASREAAFTEGSALEVTRKPSPRCRSMFDSHSLYLILPSVQPCMPVPWPATHLTSHWYLYAFPHPSTATCVVWWLHLDSSFYLQVWVLRWLLRISIWMSCRFHRLPVLSTKTVLYQPTPIWDSSCLSLLNSLIIQSGTTVSSGSHPQPFFLKLHTHSAASC